MKQNFNKGDTVLFEDNGERILGMIECQNDETSYIVSVGDCGIFTILNEKEMININDDYKL